MKSVASKSNYQPSIVDMFYKQLAMGKQISYDANNDRELQNSQNIKTENNISLKSEQDKENHYPGTNEDYSDKHVEKKVKFKDTTILPTSKIKSTNTFHSKCEYCRQKLNDDIKIYQGHPNGAVDEDIALTDPKLCLFNGSESFIHESDQRPQNKLTYFR